MIEPFRFIEPNVKICFYKHHNLYTAGTQARMIVYDMVGVKDGKIVSIATPEAEPYIAMAQKSKGGIPYYFISNGENYYIIDSHKNFRCVSRNFSHTDWNIVGKARYQAKLKLTTLHQEVAVRIIDDYMKDKIDEATKV